MSKKYGLAYRAHCISNALSIPYGAAWRVANCLCKVSYETQEEADRAAKYWTASAAPQDSYECDICGKWHLTAIREEETNGNG